MPRKSRRTAARQAQLSGRARRERPHGPTGIPEGIGTTPSVASGPGDESQVIAEAKTASGGVAASRSTAPSSRVAAVAASQPRGRGLQVAPIETYFAPEIRRIALMTGAILVILAVLVFLLR